MSNLARNDLRSPLTAFRTTIPPAHRYRSVRVLFLHRDAEIVDDCLQELEKARFVVQSDVVPTLAQCTEQLRLHAYDVVIAEFPSPCWKGPQLSQFLEQTAPRLPLLFVTDSTGSASLAPFAPDGAFDYLERGHLPQLPLALRRVLNEANLRAELAEAGKALRHSQSLYRALMENPAYGVCRCDVQGNFLDVNQALVVMLGYSSKEELLAANRTAQFVLDLVPEIPKAGRPAATLQIESIESDWTKRDGSLLKARVSGRGIVDELGTFLGYELIVVDVTDQRALEERLRRQALSDSLTGLANHRRLFEVLHAEISRSKRTGREFSVLLLDLDGLKVINDRFGHLTGNRALSRLAQILTDCCRSVDTAARQGGDEFAVVLPETGAAAAGLVARRICELLAKDTELPALSASVGIATCPRDGDSVATLLYVADRALYATKETHVRATFA
jgi:diguanylate cyclase (GGDEF)-like protein/PAS domain S-box-containing protein